MMVKVNKIYKPIVRWPNMIVARNECSLSKNLEEQKMFYKFQDKIFPRESFIEYCKSSHTKENKTKFKSKKHTNSTFIALRDYQKEAIEIIQSSKNSIIHLPTGTGKNVIITHSLISGRKYLILVPRIQRSMESKCLGGYIDIEKVYDDDTENEELEKDIELKYNLVFDKMSVTLNHEELLFQRLEEVKRYIDENSNRPSKVSKNIKTKFLGSWIGSQIQNYKNELQIMSINKIRNVWENFTNEYKDYFLTLLDEIWFNKLK